MMKYSFCFFITLVFSLPLFSQVKPATTPAATVSEDLYQTRLATLKTSVELLYRPEVKKYIDAYVNNPEQTKELINRSKIYFPIIERSLKTKNVPLDMKYLALALSELNAAAQNNYGAAGLWMMMYNVSKMYKLKVNSFVDERRDPVKSSNVAAAHFRDLYSIYHQWPLVIAAYTSSPIMLNKCIRMASNSLYFWDVYQYLPQSTKDIYPRYIAAVYILNFYKEHGIKLAATPEPVLEMDSVLVNKWLSFQQISATIDVPLDQMRKLNPVFKKDVIPYNLNGYWIYLPKGKGHEFALLKDSVYNPLPKSADFSPVMIQKEMTDSNGHVLPQPMEATPKAKTFDKQRVYYTVKKGDILTDIADWFDVTEKEIKAWNKLKSNKLVQGRRLTIWVKSNKTGYYKRINTMSKAQKKKLKNKD